MDLVSIEEKGKKIFARFPGIRRVFKKVYQVGMYTVSRNKIKSEGNLTRISPNDSEYFYGYYDKSPWDATDRYMIALNVKNAHKVPDSTEEGMVVVLDTNNSNEKIEIGTTHCWNTQQGCMAQWLGPDFKSRIIYNDFRNGKYVSVIYDFNNREELKVLDRPIYDVSKDGTYALTLDFSRLHRLRKGYGYANLEEETKKEKCPDKPCVWKLDIQTGRIDPLIKYTDLCNFENRQEMNGADHKVNHIMISPNGKRFMVIHRWFYKGEKFSRLVTMNVDGTEMYNLSDDNFVSHCCWKNDKEILSFLNKNGTGKHYYLMKDKTNEYKLLWPELNTDGHCTYSPDGKYVITDTYPNNKRIASVYLCTEEDNKYQRIARVFSPFKYDNDTRCDLHPRWNHKSDEICIDSVHDGKKELYIVGISKNIKSEIDEKYSYIPNKDDINIDRIKRRIKDFKYVSFDIFDTLIKRDVPNPSDVFTLIEREYELKTGDKIEGFKDKRILAEKCARQTCQKAEIMLEDIYSALRKDYTNEVCVKLKQIEIDIEKVICVVNNPIKEIYDFCLKEGKIIFLISNMYLSQDIIEPIINNAGYHDYKGLYISCDYMLKKSDGALFKYVLKENNLNSSEIIHIGDSWKNDYYQAKKIGISAIHINKRINHMYHTGKYIDSNDRFDFGCIKSFINNHIQLDKNAYYRFGYEAFGLLLLGFNKWMFEDLKTQGIKDVFFFSRDGYVIKRAFDILYANSDINSHYFYVSRRSLRVPQLWLNPEYEQVINVFPLAKLLTVGTFIRNLGLNPQIVQDEMKKYGLCEETVLKKVELPSNRKMRNFYEDIKPKVISHSKKECNLFLDYIKQNDFQGEVAVVDIGWHGTLQYFIQQMAQKLKLNLNMHGYYIGLATEAKRQIDIKGYVVDRNSTTNSCDSWKAFNGLAESLFLAQEGSTESFKDSGDGRIIPVLYPYEYERVDGQKDYEAIKVNELQDGAIDFVRDISQTELMNWLNFSSVTAFSSINETGVVPTKYDLKLFSDFRFLEEQVDYLAKPRSWGFYLIHPKLLKKDLGFSRWKIGFMKKLFVIPLPYEKIYKKLHQATSK